MFYTAEFSKKAAKNMQKLDKFQARLIYNWVANNLDGCKNPRSLGKPLTANLQGYWRYEVGNYRLICNIEDNICKVIVVKRKTTYEQ